MTSAPSPSKLQKMHAFRTRKVWSRRKSCASFLSFTRYHIHGSQGTSRTTVDFRQTTAHTLTLGCVCAKSRTPVRTQQAHTQAHTQAPEGVACDTRQCVYKDIFFDSVCKDIFFKSVCKDVFFKSHLSQASHRFSRVSCNKHE